MMDTIHDVLRMLVDKARGGRLPDDEAEQAHAIIDRDEQAANTPEPVPAPAEQQEEVPGGEG